MTLRDAFSHPHTPLSVLSFSLVFSMGNNAYGQCGRRIVEDEVYRCVFLHSAVGEIHQQFSDVTEKPAGFGDFIWRRLWSLLKLLFWKLYETAFSIEVYPRCHRARGCLSCTGLQSIAGLTQEDRQSFRLTFIPMANLESVGNSTCMEEPHRPGEGM